MGSTSVNQCLVWLLTLTGLSCANFPLLDVDTNMRIVLVPHDTPVGGIIYRLRASDSDNNFPLTFEVLGAVGKSLLGVNFLGCVESESLCQADVVLKKALDLGRNYEFLLQVKDTTGDYTKVHAAITATPGAANFNPLFGPRIIHLDEDCKEGTVLEKFEVLKNELNSRVVHLEIRDIGERIGLKQRLISNNRTEGTLFLKKSVDFETQPWFTFQLLAMNGWTNTTIDTRNILVADVIVAVHDVQDTPPSFTLLPASVELNNSIKMGDLVVKVEAVDGDKQNKRLIRYGFLTDANPFVVFFDLDPMTGEIRLRRNITELLRMAKPNEPIKMTIIAEEIIPESGRYGRSTRTSLDRTMGNITFWFGKGTSLGPPMFSSDRYIGEINENSLQGTVVQFGSTSLLSVSHPNPNEIITLSLSTGLGSANANPNSNSRSFIGPVNSNIYNQNQILRTFELIPSNGRGNFSFEVRVADPTLLDFELYQEIKLLLMGSTQSGLFQEAEVTIHLRDENDNAPIFSQSEYKVELPEHSPVGTKVVQLKASDKDTAGNFGHIVYSGLLGSDAFHLDPETGEITVDKPELLDRETEPEIRLHVEAKDGGHTEFSNPNTIRNIATATVVVRLHDKNDNRPEFLQKYYQAVLSPELTSFKTPVFVKAYDTDEGANGQVKYQSQDSKFFVDPTTGEVRMRGSYHRNPSDGDGPYMGSFKIRAYDLGNPQQSSETVVQLFSEEMVTREIQFVFPSSPDKIRRNQTSIEKMLSSLTGGVVGIQKITPLDRSRSGLLDASGRQLENSDINNNDWPDEDQNKGRSLVPVGSKDAKTPKKSPKDLNSNVGGGTDGKKAEELSSGSDKSLVTATVQYPVSATPTRVDLGAFQRAYGAGVDGSGHPKPSPGQDTDMVRLYEAENRALFWILVTFLLILLILFTIFLCCVYCPCCWLYGHCYSKGDKSARSDRERERAERTFLEKRQVRHTRKTYPSADTEDSREGYSNDLESGYRDRRPPPRQRREAWSGDDHKSSWRGHPRRYRDRPSTPHGKGKHRRQEADVSLEDWDFEPTQINPRLTDRAEEIGPRWQNIQHQQQQLPPQPQTITVPVPMSLMPAVQQQLQQQQQQQHNIQPQPRRVGYVGHPHPGDEDYQPRRSQPPPENVVQIQGPYPNYIQGEMEQSQHPRHYPGGGTAPGPESGRTPRQRETRFFKTETGEVLQFADFEGDEGKELLMKRYIDDQQQQQQQLVQVGEGFSTLDPPGESPRSRSLKRDNSEDLPEETTQASNVDRPRAAVTKRPQKPSRRSKEVEIVERVDHQDQQDEILIRDETANKTNSKSKTNKVKTKPDVDTNTTKEKSKASRQSRRSQSLSDDVETDGSNNNTKSESKSKSKSKSVSSRDKSTSKSKSRSRSHSPIRKSKSQSPRPSSSTPPVEKKSSKSTLKDSKDSKGLKHSKSLTSKPSKHSKEEKAKDSLDEPEGKKSKPKSEDKGSANPDRTERSDRHHHRKHKSRAKEDKQIKEKVDQTTSPGPIPIISQSHEGQGSGQEAEAEVDINIIPPSSAPMTDSSYSKENNENENERVNSLPQSPDGETVAGASGAGNGPSKPSKTVKKPKNSKNSKNNENASGTGTTQVVRQNISEEIHENDDEDSGIGISGVGVSKRNKMLEKKSVFTIAYDDVAQKTLTMRPDTGNNSNAEAEGEVKG